MIPLLTIPGKISIWESISISMREFSELLMLIHSLRNSISIWESNFLTPKVFHLITILVSLLLRILRSHPQIKRNIRNTLRLTIREDTPMVDLRNISKMTERFSPSVLCGTIKHLKVDSISTSLISSYLMIPSKLRKSENKTLERIHSHCC